MIDDRRYSEMLEKYAALEVKMRDLYGNGTPGRVTLLEGTVGSHSRYLWMAIGALAIITPIVLELARVYIQHLWK